MNHKNNVCFYALFILFALFNCYSLSTVAQNTCANAININSIPFTSNSQSSCSKVNDYTTYSCFSGKTLNLEDFVYKFTPTADGCFNFNLTNISSDPFSTPTLHFAILDNCPNAGGNCLKSATINVSFGVGGVTFLYLQKVSLKAGVTYYIVIDGIGTAGNGGALPCFNFNFEAKSTTCPPPELPTTPQGVECGTNLGFESGNLSNWKGFTGTYVAPPIVAPTAGFIPGVNSVNGTQGTCVSNPAANIGTRHTVMTGAATDPNTDNTVTVVAPGGRNYSARIGNHEAGAQTECLEQTFTVSAANPLFTYLYAVIMQDPNANHTDNEKPRFEITLKDKNGNMIPCGGQYSVYSSNASEEGFLNASSPQCGTAPIGNTPGDVWYKPWTAVSTDLSNYINQQVTIRFCTADCSQGGHYGYAYVDTYCKPKLIEGTTVCALSGGSVTLTAPYGFSNYKWYSGTNVNGTPVATGQIYNLTNPANGSIYTVKFESIASPGCFSQITDTIKIVSLKVNNDTSLCVNSGSSFLLKADFLDPASTYSWTSIPAGFTSTSPTPTVSPLPAVTTTYVVTAKSPLGCSMSDAVVITINPQPTLSVNSPSVCLGVSASLSCSGANSYSWSPASGLNATSGATVVATVANTSTYTLTGSNAFGCTNTTSATVTIFPLPTITSTNSSICKGGSTSLSAGGANTFSWSPSTGLSNNTANPVNVSLSTLGLTTYTVTGTTAQGCTGTTTATVEVFNCLLVKAQDTTLCEGYCAILKAVASTGVPNYTYTWSGGLADLSSVCPASTTDYTVTATDANGNTASDILTVTIEKTPVIIVAPSSICLGTCANLSAGGASTYTWSPATGLNSTIGSSVKACNLNTSQTYTVNGSSTAGCTNYTTVTVTVNPLPTINANPGTICSGGSAQLSASGATSYSWSPAIGVTPNPGNPVVAKPIITTTYTVTGKDNNGCINSATTVVTVYPNPTIVVNNASICFGKSAGLTANGANTYVWTPATFLNQTSGNLVVSTPTVTSDYIVTGTDNYGCSGTTTSQVLVYPLPTLTAISKQICLHQNTTLTVTGAANYSWTPANGLNPTTGANVVANPTVTTKYTISATSLYNCTATTTVQVTVHPIPTIVASIDTICEGQLGDLTATGANTYTWQPTGSTGSVTNDAPLITTSYTVTGTSINGCTQTSTAYIYVKTYPNVDFDVNPGIANIYEAKIHFTNLTTPKDNKYLWIFGDDSTSVLEHPVHTYGDTGKYKVCLFADKEGCIRELCKPVIIIPEWTFYVPNAFTPNGDKLNEGFIGVGTYIKTYEMWIFDRWGNLIYHCRDMDKPWNGRVNNGINGEDIAQEDVYIWKIKITDVFDKKHSYLGHVTIVK